jgi:photosystem II reaction center protein PsbM
MITIDNNRWAMSTFYSRTLSRLNIYLFRGDIELVIDRQYWLQRRWYSNRYLTTTRRFDFSVLATVTKAAFVKGAAAIPVAALAAPAFAMDSVVDALPSTALSMEVQFGAYLAVLLGTFLPALFLVNLYVQTETRKAGAEDALNDSEFS